MDMSLSPGHESKFLLPITCFFSHLPSFFVLPSSDFATLGQSRCDALLNTTGTEGKQGGATKRCRHISQSR